jgi:hypothetical protein
MNRTRDMVKLPFSDSPKHRSHVSGVSRCKKMLQDRQHLLDEQCKWLEKELGAESKPQEAQ